MVRSCFGNLELCDLSWDGCLVRVVSDVIDVVYFGGHGRGIVSDIWVAMVSPARAKLESGSHSAFVVLSVVASRLLRSLTSPG